MPCSDGLRYQTTAAEVATVIKDTDEEHGNRRHATLVQRRLARMAGAFRSWTPHPRPTILQYLRLSSVRVYS